MRVWREREGEGDVAEVNPFRASQIGFRIGWSRASGPSGPTQAVLRGAPRVAHAKRVKSAQQRLAEARAAQHTRRNEDGVGKSEWAGRGLARGGGLERLERTR